LTMSRIRSHWKIAGLRLDVYRVEGDSSVPAIASERAKTSARAFVRPLPGLARLRSR
jgi:hypothetical protein